MNNDASTGIDWNDPAIEDIRRDMLRFARLQLRDSSAAEDMVQEAFVAAIQNAESFAGRAAFKTWLFAILRNKIIDHLRKRARESTRSELETDDEAGAARIEALFNRTMMWMPGMWNLEDRPESWPAPDEALASKQFWTIFEACLHGLPEKLSRIYMMREFLDLETAEICAELTISRNNCWVILYRARTGLRECLENNWLHGEVRS